MVNAIPVVLPFHAGLMFVRCSLANQVIGMLGKRTAGITPQDSTVSLQQPRYLLDPLALPSVGR